MNNKWKVALAILPVALLSGFCGAAVGASTTTGEDQRVEVEVPGPTKTVEAPAPTVTEEVEVEVVEEVVPQACLDAIKEAEDIAEQVYLFTEESAKFPPMVGEAYEAGMTYDNAMAQDIIRRMNEASEAMDQITADTQEHVYDFGVARRECKAAAQR